MSYSYGEALTSISQLKGRDSVDLLARVIYDEARGESWAGKQGGCCRCCKQKEMYCW